MIFPLEALQFLTVYRDTEPFQHEFNIVKTRTRCDRREASKDGIGETVESSSAVFVVSVRLDREVV
jgi:hypothetical protein